MYDIALTYVDKVEGWPLVKGGDSLALDQCALFFNGCHNTMNDIKYMSEIKHLRSMQKINQKLPVFSLG